MTSIHIQRPIKYQIIETETNLKIQNSCRRSRRKRGEGENNYTRKEYYYRESHSKATTFENADHQIGRNCKANHLKIKVKPVFNKLITGLGMKEIKFNGSTRFPFVSVLRS